MVINNLTRKICVHISTTHPMYKLLSHGEVYIEVCLKSNRISIESKLDQGFTPHYAFKDIVMYDLRKMGMYNKEYSLYDNGETSGILSYRYVETNSLSDNTEEESDEEEELVIVREYYDSGPLKSESHFEANEKDGMYKEYYLNGSLKLQTNFKGEFRKFEGICIRYNNYGYFDEQANYVNGKKEGDYMSFWGNGNKATQCILRNGEKEGLNTEWFENGKKEFECTYLNGERHGLFTKYHNNGKVREASNWFNGEREGEWVTYFEDGVVKKVSNWVNGCRCGEFKSYWPNSERRMECKYTLYNVYGAKNGVCEVWGLNGSHQKTVWDNGILKGSL